MANPLRREFAPTIVLDDRDRFLLQQRDDIAGIFYPGKIGLFGGHREGDETFLDCAVRELHEEQGYFIAPERFESLDSYEGPDLAIQADRLRQPFCCAQCPCRQACGLGRQNLCLFHRQNLALSRKNSPLPLDMR
jgi:8-oxo-dGTP pyrophosphatase MutT (NUDIX family)